MKRAVVFCGRRYDSYGQQSKLDCKAISDTVLSHPTRKEYTDFYPKPVLNLLEPFLQQTRLLQLLTGMVPGGPVPIEARPHLDTLASRIKNDKDCKEEVSREQCSIAEHGLLLDHPGHVHAVALHDVTDIDDLG